MKVGQDLVLAVLFKAKKAALAGRAFRQQLQHLQPALFVGDAFVDGGDALVDGDLRFHG
ncbi:hypothetical protein D3C83_276100 [compost metagenome]